MQSTWLLELAQDLVEPGFDRTRGAFPIGRHLELATRPSGGRNAVHAEAPHPDTVPDLRDIVVAGVEEFVSRRIAPYPKALHDEIHLPEAAGVGLRYGPDVLQQYNARAVALHVGEDAPKGGARGAHLCKRLPVGVHHGEVLAAEARHQDIQLPGDLSRGPREHVVGAPAAHLADILEDQRALREVGPQELLLARLLLGREDVLEGEPRGVVAQRALERPGHEDGRVGA
mmetsp:Transcript_35842/g.99340  ORF Transcript_35842/g.99340 Transcript_35842/m.99340 type:complete len:229 (-) Transcript_35842:2524-3210(-)